VAASLGSPKKTPQAETSGLGAHLAAGIPWMKTVEEPVRIGVGGVGGGGGCAIPPLIAPLQTAVQPTCAAGKCSMSTCPKGQGPDGGGPMTPEGTSKS